MTFEVRTGDALKLLRLIPTASIDCVITDPPYGDTSLAWDTIVNGWADEALRVLKPSGSMWMFGSMRYLMAVMPTLKKWHMTQDIVWEKHTGSGAAADRFRRVHEHAVQFVPRGRPWGGVFQDVQYTHGHAPLRSRRKLKPAHWGGIGEHVYVSDGRRLMRSVIRVRNEHGRAVHPTQKPEGILLPLIRYSCPPLGIVLDPFAGSGSTGCAAMRCERSFIGIEIDPAMASVARNRVAEAHAQGIPQRIEGVA
jgi:site-specific DNA-methyltransferase (adenine-specific)